MKLRAYRRAAGARERGFAMIAILALAALMSAYLIAAALNPDAAAQVIDRERRNMNALRQAKAALIAYAANEQWQKYKAETANQPGALPCPDLNNDGNSDGALCNNGPSFRIGRLPYKTIGSPDLTDASGERLWYAVSSNFYKDPASVINSDTPGLLTVTGTAPVTDVVAIVFAPGPPILDPLLPGQFQSRSPPTNINRVASYLEGFTATSPDYTFATSALPGNTQNDRLLTITQAELMAAVEPVVATRIQRDIRPYVRNYLNSPGWTGRYPFAVPWGAGPSMSQDDYKGDASPTYEGLMPVSTQAGFVQWNTASISVTQLVGGTGIYVGGTPPAITVDCSASTGAQISCQIDYPGTNNDRPEIRLQATLINAAKAFVNAPAETVQDFWGNTQGWSNTRSPNPFTFGRSLLVDGNGALLIEGRLINAQTMANRATILVPVTYHNVSNPADPTSGWFIANQWHRQTYYAVSTGGGVSCVVGTSCLTVNNLDTGNITNGRLILVFSGRTLNGPTMRTGTLAEYFELENATTGNRIFQHHRFGMPTTINDQVVVVQP